MFWISGQTFLAKFPMSPSTANPCGKSPSPSEGWPKVAKPPEEEERPSAQAPQRRAFPGTTEAPLPPYSAACNSYAALAFLP